MRISKVICLLLSLLFWFFTGMAEAQPKIDLVKLNNKQDNVSKIKTAANEASGRAQDSGRRTFPSSKILQLQKGAALMPNVVNIPAGCFQMGSPETEQGRSGDEMLHRVCVKGFKLAKNEVTVEEFSRFVTATNFITDAEQNIEETGCWSYEKNPEKPWDWRSWASWKKPIQGPYLMKTYPVSCVSLNDVLAYIDWLNRETGQQYRLPTEAEWEYTARAKTATARYWGNNPDIACSYANVADNTKSGPFKWPETHDCEDGYFFAATVKTFRANNFNLHDMLGNVWEWTCTKYEEKYAGNEDICLDIKPADDILISIRGGGWNADAPRIRAASRNWGVAWSRQANLGFRLVKVR
ncbi:MAG: formylglycine-generating enzyme family protein [Methylobacter sp.]